MQRHCPLVQAFYFFCSRCIRSTFHIFLPSDRLVSCYSRCFLLFHFLCSVPLLNAPIDLIYSALECKMNSEIDALNLFDTIFFLRSLLSVLASFILCFFFSLHSLAVFVAIETMHRIEDERDVSKSARIHKHHDEYCQWVGGNNNRPKENCAGKRKGKKQM